MLGSIACGDGDGDDQLRSFVVRFAAQAGDEAVQCSEPVFGLGAIPEDQPVYIEDFRIYLHDLRLLNSEGQEVSVSLDQDSPFSNNDIVLLDFENGSGRCKGTNVTHTEVNVEAEIDEVTGMVFVVGIPFSENHINISNAEAPLNVSRMHWNWRGGYKFMRIDLDVDGGGLFPIHLGSTGCVSDSALDAPEEPCSKPNYPIVRLDTFDPDNNTVVFDLANLVDGVDLRNNTPETVQGCQSFGGDDVDCTSIFESLGLSYETGTCEQECVGQSFVRVE